MCIKGSHNSTADWFKVQNTNTNVLWQRFYQDNSWKHYDSCVHKKQVLWLVDTFIQQFHHCFSERYSASYLLLGTRRSGRTKFHETVWLTTGNGPTPQSAGVPRGEEFVVVGFPHESIRCAGQYRNVRVQEPQCKFLPEHRKYALTNTVNRINADWINSYSIQLIQLL